MADWVSSDKTAALSFARTSLQYPATFYLSQFLYQLAATDHLGLIKLVLESYHGRASIDQIQQALVPDVIRDDWKKWWEVAKRELKKDGHFQVPTKKSDPIVYQAQEVPLQQRLIGDFRAAKGLKAKLKLWL